MRATLVVLLAVLTVVCAATAFAKRIPPPIKPVPYSAPTRESVHPDMMQPPSPMQSAAAADTFELAFYDFDNGNLPDAQGWISVDWTAQVDEYFHVADGTELDGGTFGTLLPLEGAQSLWLGLVQSSDPELCGYASLPGYANDWDQYFVSNVFACDSLRLTYKVQWDSESGYDETQVHYFDNDTGTWAVLPARDPFGFYAGTGSMVDTLIVTPSGGTTQIRFWFFSDGAFSDQDGLYSSDGAILIDSLTVECYNNGNLTMLLFEDFEGEAPGSKATDDGWWSAQPAPSFGDFAALYPGSTVLQEDDCVINKTNLWAFFTDPAIAGYDCHTPNPVPQQGVIPFGDANGLYMDNLIWSPPIAITGAGDTYVFSFKVYRDLRLDNLVGYTWRVRSFVNGCAQPWRDFSSGFHFGGQKDWLTATFNVGSIIDDGATEIQLAIGAQDWCDVWCNVFGTGACHSHAPLFDDVRLVRVNHTGPQLTLRDVDFFQDNFAEDGTLTGTARADAAIDILPSSSPGIQPGDSSTVTVFDGVGIAIDPLSGVGPAIYAYVAVWPLNQSGKTGADMEASESRSIGKRFPLVGSLIHDGVTWNCFRMDTAITSAGGRVADRFCFDLNDAVFTPGDTICYFLRATNTASQSNYASRRSGGQGEHFVADDITEAFASPMEFTILPAGGFNNGGDILYVDDADGRGGEVPIQIFFDSAFQAMGIGNLVDRYDVLRSSSVAGNSLASRVKDVAVQISDPYQKIIWSSASLLSGTVGDGTGNPEKSDDFALLESFLSNRFDNPGVLFTGDNIAAEWVTLAGPSAVTLRTTFMNFNLANEDHVAEGEPVSPVLVGSSPVFTHGGTPDEFLAFGGCPLINQFDVLLAAGASQADLVSSGLGNSFAVSQETTNSQSTTARVMLMGFSLHEAADLEPTFPFARAEILTDVIEFFQNVLPQATGIESDVPDVAFLGDNYPNPFNPTTTIRYGLKERGHVSLRIYNTAGQLVKILVDTEMTPQPGGFKIEWLGDSDTGSRVASGVYFYKLVTERFVDTKKMVLLK